MTDIWLGIDLGTQSVHALAATGAGDVAGTGASPLVSRRDGHRHEQDPEAWWSAVGQACRAAVASIPAPAAIRGVAVCGTSGTVLLTNTAGNPLTPGLMYDDARAVAEAERVNHDGAALWSKLGYQKIQTVWGLPKLIWLLHHVKLPKGAYLAHQSDFVNQRLAGHRLPADLSNALKTGCDTVEERWPFDLMERLGIAADVLPELRRAGSVLGTVCRAAADHTGIPAGTPIIAGMTDGCASQLSSGAVAPGDWNSVLGTTLVLKGTSERLLHDPNGVVYSHRSPDGRWLPGGASSSGAGALSQYLAGADLDALAEVAARRSARSGLVAFPLASERGERFPFVAADAHAFFLEPPADDVDTYIALTQGVAAVERLCFDYLDLLGFPADGRISLTGGTSRNARWNRARATMLGRPLVVPHVAEPAFGMAVLASTTTRPLTDALAAMVRIDRTYEPEPAAAAGATESYRRLVDSLEERGWLPARTAAHARERANS